MRMRIPIALRRTKGEEFGNLWAPPWPPAPGPGHGSSLDDVTQYSDIYLLTTALLTLLAPLSLSWTLRCSLGKMRFNDKELAYWARSFVPDREGIMDKKGANKGQGMQCSVQLSTVQPGQWL